MTGTDQSVSVVGGSDGGGGDGDVDGGGGLSAVCHCRVQPGTRLVLWGCQCAWIPLTPTTPV